MDTVYLVNMMRVGGMRYRGPVLAVALLGQLSILSTTTGPIEGHILVIRVLSRRLTCLKL